MKRLILLFWGLVLWGLSGCTNVQSLLLYDTDKTLATIQQVQALPQSSSVGFEWKSIRDKRVQGINIYRGLPTHNVGSDLGFKHIGSVSSRYATHFVDSHVLPNTTYFYTFTTYSLGKESKHGKVLKVKTHDALEAVSFLKAYKVSKQAIKLLWKPHTNDRINAYIIECSVNGGTWQYMDIVHGKLMVEYIDNRVQVGNQYAYRVFARGYDKIRSKASQITRLSLQ